MIGWWLIVLLAALTNPLIFLPGIAIGAIARSWWIILPLSTAHAALFVAVYFARWPQIDFLIISFGAALAWSGMAFVSKRIFF